jgi:hypothetical protein
MDLPGVKEVYASSAFQIIEVTFDPKQTSAEKIAACLQDTGYMGTLPAPTETGIAGVKKDGGEAFRSTAIYETIKKTVSFSQRVNYEGRPLWPCPGLGTVKVDE